MGAFLLLFAVLYALMTASLLLPDRTYSEMENKYMAELPAFTFKSLFNGTFMERYNTYVSDQLPGRDLWISLRSLTESLFLKTENSGVVYGDDGYLFQKFTSYDKGVLEENVSAIADFCSRTDAHCSVMVVPSSYTVLQDKVPAGVLLADERSVLSPEADTFSSLGDNCSVINVLSTLDRHSSEYIYYRTDHHWTTDGAWYAYNTLCVSLALDSVYPDQKRAHETPGFLGTSYTKCKKAGQQSDILKHYAFDAVLTADGNTHDTIYDYTKLTGRDKYAMFLYGNGAERNVVSGPAEGKKTSLLVIKDSFADCLIPFLTTNYENITCIDPRYYSGSFSQLLEGEYDDVLIIFGFEDLATDSSILKLGF